MVPDAADNIYVREADENIRIAEQTHTVDLDPRIQQECDRKSSR